MSANAWQENIDAPNIDGIVILPSGGSIATNGVSANQSNPRGRALKLYIATGAFGVGVSNITVTVGYCDLNSGSYFKALTSAPLAPNALQVLSIGPGLNNQANVSLCDILPKTWLVTWQATAWGQGGSVLGIGAAINV